jgi:ParB-like chromosome segregation protein Spo0J
MSQQRGLSLAAGEECLLVSVPLQLKRRGGRKQIIAPDGQTPHEPLRPRPNASLALTIARAHRWRELLEDGSYTSIRALAQALGMDNSYLARFLRLTLLAPDSVEAILEGTEPSGLSLEKLYRAPMDWESQRRQLGMPSRQ